MPGKIGRRLHVDAVLPKLEGTKKRKSFVILCDVIRASYNGARKTHIMYRSNLNPLMLEKYLEFCLNHGLIEREEEGYRATSRGSELVRRLEEISVLKKSIEELAVEAKKLIEEGNQH